MLYPGHQNSDVETSRDQPVGEEVRAARLNGDEDIGMPFMKRTNGPPYEPPGQAWDDADKDLSLVFTTDRFDSAGQLIDAAEDPVGLFIETHAALGWNKASARAVKKLHFRIVFQMGNELARRRLGDPHHFCRATDRAGLHDRHQRLDLAEAWLAQGITFLNMMVRISLLTFYPHNRKKDKYGREPEVEKPDTIVVGGGAVGAAIAYGLVKRGERVLVLEGGDRDFRAARANFGLVWVQGKGATLPPYRKLTRGSSDMWPEFDLELSDRADQRADYSRPGGLKFCLGADEFDERTQMLRRMHNEDANPDTEMLDRRTLEVLLPDMTLGSDVTGASFCWRDGHVNPLRLLASLHRAILRSGGKIAFRNPVDRIVEERDGFRLECAALTYHANKVVVAAGLATQKLVAPLGLDVPMRAERGQILVTERIAPVLPLPASGLRQTAEGTMMIGATNEDVGLDTGTTSDAAATLSRRAVQTAPQLAQARIVRQWSGLRVLSPDGGPIYAQSETSPGLFAASCHSGVTLAAVHADVLAPAIAAGHLPDEMRPFSERRFDVRKCA